MTYTETEVKFHIADLDKLAARLVDLGAQLTSPRTHEHNLRFDTPAGTLSRQACALRLRRDAESRLTFKGVSTRKEGIVSREEIEFTVGDFDKAQRFLEALGYQVFALYEKYRTIYTLGDLHFMLDEMPYGNFLEIEGLTIEAIQKAAYSLNLNWDAAIKTGYLGIFGQLSMGKDWDKRNLSFDALKEFAIDLGNISIYAADI